MWLLSIAVNHHNQHADGRKAYCSRHACCGSSTSVDVIKWRGGGAELLLLSISCNLQMATRRVFELILVLNYHYSVPACSEVRSRVCHLHSAQKSSHARVTSLLLFSSSLHCCCCCCVQTTRACGEKCQRPFSILARRHSFARLAIDKQRAGGERCPATASLLI